MLQKDIFINGGIENAFVERDKLSRLVAFIKIFLCLTTGSRAELLEPEPHHIEAPALYNCFKNTESEVKLVSTIMFTLNILAYFAVWSRTGGRIKIFTRSHNDAAPQNRQS
jgi:hypothetical protein